MTDVPMVGGKRRIDEVLSPGFVDGLADLDMAEVRRRRDLSRAERDYLSFVRRLLQGRRDLLRDEQRRREEGGEPGSLIERVAAVLAEGTRGSSRGEAVVVSLPDTDVNLARRRVERLLSDARLSDVEGLSDDDLRETVERLEKEERAISETRASVLEVHDSLQDELKGRLRAQHKGLLA